MLTVCTFLWHDPKFKWGSQFTYTPRHVDRLARAVKERLHIPHRFVAITDQAEWHSTAVDEIVPLWDDLRDLGSCYTRLKCFDPAMRDVLGERFAWLDLDCVVCGDLTPLFARPDDFVMWKPDSILRTPRNQFCGSMVMMDTGCRPQVWEEFDPDVSPQITREVGLIGSDQAWITYVLGTENEATWGRKDGVLSFRGHIARHNVLPGRAKRMGQSMDLPEDARIVFLHGNFDISLPLLHRYYPWIEAYWNS